MDKYDWNWGYLKCWWCVLNKCVGELKGEQRWLAPLFIADIYPGFKRRRCIYGICCDRQTVVCGCQLKTTVVLAVWVSRIPKGWKNVSQIVVRFTDPHVMRMSGIVPDHGAHIGDSAVCATCHTLYTTAFDEMSNLIEGVEPFPEQVPYLEWEYSVFGDGAGEDTSCQECHMPVVEGEAKLSNRGRAPLRTDFGIHTFDGSNAFMLKMLRDNGTELGVMASSDQFNESIAINEEMLGLDTAVIEMTDSTIDGSTLMVDLQVTNLVGHKFPTGIPIRRVWIHLTAVDEMGAVVFESGAPLVDGRIQGNDGDEETSIFEPNYSVIKNESQVQIYEGVMADWNGDVTYTLLRATQYLKDNRLLPLGFEKTAVPDDVKVWGLAEVDPDFVGGGDAIRYEIPLGDVEGAVTVTAELLYQPVSYGFVQDLGNDSSEYVDRFVGFNEMADQTPDLVSEVSVTLP